MTPDPGPRPTVMVVEDNEVTRAGLAAALREAGYEVVPVRDGREALDHLARGPAPDLILLDMLMPVLDGWHFLEELSRPHPPVVVVTATVLSREWAATHGCAGFLRKPLATEEVLAEVERCLGG